MEYRPLSHEDNEIRLLTILDNRSADVTCTLEHVSLYHLPSFTALSYCWGDPENTQTAMVNDAAVQITANLDSALRQFRGEAHGKLWIDALCINQDDEVERGLQVLRMGEIYFKASEVVAWLGPTEHASNKAMLLLDFLGLESAPGFGYPPGTRPLAPGPGSFAAVESRMGDVESWQALAKLLGRPYWKRMWVVQEIAFAKRVVFRCGDMAVDFEALRGMNKMMSRLNKSRFIPVPMLKGAHMSSIHGIQLFRDLADNSGTRQLPLTTALWSSRDQIATDPRDRVYGILGLSNDGPKLIPNPSYGVSAGQLYTSLTRSLIVNSKRLDYIRYKSPFGLSDLDMPSWALDLATPCFEASTWYATAQPMSIPVSWSRTNKTYDGDPTFEDSKDGTHAILKTRGLLLDTVDGLAAVVKFDQRQNFNSETNYRITQPHGQKNAYGADAIMLSAIAESMAEFGAHDLDCVFLVMLGFKQLWQERNRAIIQRLAPLVLPWLDQNRDLLIVGRTLHDWSQEGPESMPLAAWQKLLRPDPPLGDADLENGAAEKGLVELLAAEISASLSKYRRFMITANGYVGTAHPQAKRGDKVYLLQGCAIPVILRESGVFHRVIGDGKVFGFTDGTQAATRAWTDIAEGRGEMLLLV